jgi:two-component system, LytTR family, sensor kinase
MNRRHFFAWLGYFCFMLIYAYSNAKKPGDVDLATFFFGNLLLICIFYYNYLIVQPIYFEKSKQLGIVYFFCGLFAYYSIRYLLTHQFLPALGKKIYDADLKGFLATHTYLYIVFSIYALLTWYFRKTIATERKLRITETEMLAAKYKILQAENEKVLSDYNYLKAQINPHFLFNTLNFFYAATSETNPYAAEGINLLSQIMRYSLLKDDGSGQVPLKMEWNQLQNFTDLHQMRYEESLPLAITHEGNMEGVRVMPHLLITLVENAFKHGNNHQPMRVHLSVQETTLQFTVRNHLDHSSKKVIEGSGVGLQNIRQRLLHQYGDAAHFNCWQQNGEFMVTLQIPIVRNASILRLTGEKHASS